MDLKEKTSNVKRHPWELSRADNLLNICEKSLARTNQSLKIADVGAGDNYFDFRLRDSLIKKGFDPKIYAIDTAYSCYEPARIGITFLNNISEIADKSMDLIILMDVLEHIEDDSAFLGAVIQKLNAQGNMIITVPAFQHLFSSHDEFLDHYRRYNYTELNRLLAEHNLHIQKSHYFYFTLYLLRTMQVKFRVTKKTNVNHGIGLWKYGNNSLLTRLFRVILNTDFRLNTILSGLGLLLPGLSLLAVIKNDSNQNNI